MFVMQESHRIYEGANWRFRRLDLMGRKTVRSKGELLEILSGEMDEFVASQKGVEAMQPYLAAFEKCRGAFGNGNCNGVGREAVVT